MAISETFDLLDIAGGNFAPAGDDRLDTVKLVIGDAAPIGDDQPEPILASAPFFIEFDEPERLDPARIGLTWELPPASRPAMRWRSPLTSLAVHLLPLLIILGWPKPAADLTPPIAIELVFEQPPPPPQPVPDTPPQQPEHPQGPLASEDMGNVKPKAEGTAATEAPPAPGEKAPSPAETQTAAAAPPPIPPLKPAPPREPSPVSLPKPAGTQAPPRENTPHEAPRAARYAGPSASRDEYLAYLVALTRQHLNLLPLSLVGSRSGETVVSVVVMADGAIGPVSVARSSRYPDIDQRIAQMVKAVGKFPPLPQWYQGNAVQLELTMRFPEALER